MTLIKCDILLISFLGTVHVILVKEWNSSVPHNTKPTEQVNVDTASININFHMIYCCSLYIRNSNIQLTLL